MDAFKNNREILPKTFAKCVIMLFSAFENKLKENFQLQLS